jgi:hypothetical protein
MTFLYFRGAEYRPTVKQRQSPASYVISAILQDNGRPFGKTSHTPIGSYYISQAQYMKNKFTMECVNEKPKVGSPDDIRVWGQ